MIQPEVLEAAKKIEAMAEDAYSRFLAANPTIETNASELSRKLLRIAFVTGYAACVEDHSE